MKSRIPFFWHRWAQLTAVMLFALLLLANMFLVLQADNSYLAEPNVQVEQTVPLTHTRLVPRAPLTTTNFPLDVAPSQFVGTDDLVYGAAWGDVDGDGDLDLATAVWQETDKVYLNVNGVLQGTAVWESANISDTRSVAWGDVDGDGDLDLAANNALYINDGMDENGEQLQLVQSDWQSDGADFTYGVAWGDVDGDGDLDLAITDYWTARVYLNVNGVLQNTAAWTSEAVSNTDSVAWGDVDGDGDLDLATGSNGANKVYTNENGQLEATASWTSDEVDWTFSLAWGDVDGDGDLDLATGGNRSTNRVYLNEEGVLQTTAGWTSNDADATRTIAWGDVDGDGDLDLAAGNGFGTLGEANKVYLNVNGQLQEDAGWVSQDEIGVSPVAWGDVDGDGDLDLAAGAVIYLNANGALASTPDWKSGGSEVIYNVAWGDVDGDGDPDLAVSDEDGVKLYEQVTGTFRLAQTWEAMEGIDISSPSSLAWGDVDGDGDLDLAAGGRDDNRIFENVNGELEESAGFWSSFDNDNTRSIAWGDVDGDGDLDLAVGNIEHPNKIYENLGNTLEVTADYWVADNSYRTLSIAWADVDGDGDLDLATGNVPLFDVGCGCYSDNGANRLYLNNDGQLNTQSDWESDSGSTTYSIAWGDVDGDGDLDLAAGNQIGANRVYINENGMLQTTAAWQSSDFDTTYSIAWVDVDGDGDLDLAAGNTNTTNEVKVYLNINGVLQTVAQNPWIAAEGDGAQSIAWADVNGDGDFDLAAGTINGVKLYQNGKGERASILPAGTMPFLTVDRPIDAPLTNGYVPSETVTSRVIPIHYQLRDYEGHPISHITAEYSPNGGGQWFPAVATTQTVMMNLATGYNQIDYADLMPNTTITQGEIVTAVIAVTDTFNVNTLHLSFDLIYDGFISASLRSPNGTHIPLFSGDLDSCLCFPTFDLTLSDQATSTLVSALSTLSNINNSITGNYAPVGSFEDLAGEPAHGDWLLIIEDSTIPVDPMFPKLGALNSWQLHFTTVPEEYVFEWDTFASGIFGSLDNVVFRIEAYPQYSTIDITGTHQYFNQALFPIQRPYASATTSPFRVQGTQVQVFAGSATTGNEVANAIVWRVPAGTSTAQVMGSSGQPFMTDAQGYLSGQGELAFGDQLIALVPDETAELPAGLAADKVEVYLTNMTNPTATPPESFTVEEAGVQKLIVSEQNRLMLFNLDVSLEWDGRQDEAYMADLQLQLQQASNLLFDWTNGQMALGRIRIFHDREMWREADIRILASNRYRPNAAIGGILDEDLTEQPLGEEIRYSPGQIRMGSTWDRFGESGTTLTEDWTRTLVHELGHYLLFMNDNYFGFDAEGNFVNVFGCPGTMANPYINQDVNGYDEFHSGYNWDDDCVNTASNRATGRSDWETLRTFYPQLNAPTVTTYSVAGPNGNPFIVTFPIVENDENDENPDPSAALEEQSFILYDNSGGVYIADKQAQAYIIRDGEHILDLGGAIDNQLLARGVQAGDRVCLQDVRNGHYGCKLVLDVDANGLIDDSNELRIDTDAAWEPDIIIRPADAENIIVTVKLPSPPLANTMGAKLYPNGTAPVDYTDMVVDGSGTVFTFTFSLDEVIVRATLHVWGDYLVGEGDSVVPTEFNTITSYELGGNPGLLCDWFGVNCSNNGSAPVFSPDGRAIINGESLEFSEGQFYVLQTAAALQEEQAIPAWGTQVGQVYRLTASDEAPAFLDGAQRPTSYMRLSYLLREVPRGAEDELVVYYFDEDNPADGWVSLPTAADTQSLELSAPVLGRGLYMIFATIDTPQLNAGWNLFAYPNVNTRPVDVALSSLNPIVYDCDTYCYTSVYQNQNETWWLHDQTVIAEHGEFAPIVNKLDTLAPLNSYWIYATTEITPLIKPSTPETSAENRAQLGLPPATFYGWVTPTAELNAAVGDTVEAWIDDSLCGTTTITNSVGIDGQLAYAMQVSADNGNGCGTVGREITFTINDQLLSGTRLWVNQQANFYPLMEGQMPLSRVYLPLIQLDAGNVIVAPDLVVSNIAVSASDVTVTIANVGNTAVTTEQAFWVDLYIDPNRTPTANDTWPVVATEGMVWGVTEEALPLGPGETLVLTIGDGYYRPELSNFSGTMPPDTPIFVQVDSAHTGTTYGAVLELHELTGGTYNNITVGVYQP